MSDNQIIRKSVVVIVNSNNDEEDRLSKECIDSVKPYADELIIINNNSNQKYDWMEKIGDKYFKTNLKFGYSKAMNAGKKLATGTSIIYVTSNTKLVQGNLIDLCGQHILIPCSHKNNNINHIDGIFLSVPNHPLINYDERFESYISYIDLLNMAGIMGLKIEIVPSVVVEYVEAKEKTIHENEKNIFISKYGYYPNNLFNS